MPRQAQGSDSVLDISEEGARAPDDEMRHGGMAKRGPAQGGSCIGHELEAGSGVASESGSGDGDGWVTTGCSELCSCQQARFHLP